jgi:predicted metal-binding membrane protein
VIVLLAGTFQLTAWKAHLLACCREAPGHGGGVLPLPAGVRTAWRQGVRLGLHCSYCCAGLTAILLAIGVMDLKVMAVLTVANTVERFSPNGARMARAIGVIALGAGALLIAHAAELG